MLYDHTGRLLGSVEQAVVDALNESVVMEKAAQELAPNTSAPFFLEPVYRNGTYVVDAAGTSIK
jgi:hypothetical protein